MPYFFYFVFFCIRLCPSGSFTSYSLYMHAYEMLRNMHATKRNSYTISYNTQATKFRKTVNETYTKQKKINK